MLFRSSRQPLKMHGILLNSAVPLYQLYELFLLQVPLYPRKVLGEESLLEGSLRHSPNEFFSQSSFFCLSSVGHYIRQLEHRQPVLLYLTALYGLKDELNLAKPLLCLLWLHHPFGFGAQKRSNNLSHICLGGGAWLWWLLLPTMFKVHLILLSKASNCHVESISLGMGLEDLSPLLSLF